MFEWLKEHPEEYSQFLKVETSASAFEEDQIIAGLGLARKKPEGEQLTYDDPIQGASRRYIHDTYSLGWQVTMEMKEDDKYNIMSQMPGELMKSSRQQIEAVGANVLNLSFGLVLTADGVSFMNSAHPLVGGGTYQNMLNPSTDISITSMQDMLLIFENTINERGLRMRLEPNFLWIPPALQFVAAQTLQSQFLPGTGNNDINPIQGRVEPRVLHFLTSNTAWFMSAGGEQNYAKFKWRKRFATETIDDFETKGTKYSIVFRIVAGATHWQGWCGSNP
jgi:hypothetical protein